MPNPTEPPPSTATSDAPAPVLGSTAAGDGLGDFDSFGFGEGDIDSFGFGEGDIDSFGFGGSYSGWL